VIILKFVDLTINIKRDKKETEIVEPEHESLRGKSVGRVDDFLDDSSVNESANVDKNPSKTLTKEELEELRQKNDDTHERSQRAKDDILPLNNENGTWKRIGNTITKF
jgi:hypothetical protein